MTEIINFLMTIDAPRDSWKIKHRLADIVLLIFFACLIGAEYWEDIEDFGLVYESSLHKVLCLENGIQKLFRKSDVRNNHLRNKGKETFMCMA